MDVSINSAFAGAFASKKRYIHLYGGRGGGKSHAKGTKMIANCMSSGYYRGMLVREVHTSIRGSQFQEIKDQLHDTGLDRFFQINETTMSFRCNLNGNTIISRGLKKSSSAETAKVKSIKDVTDVWIEEADEINKDDFRKLDMSIRTTKAPLQITFTYNTDIEETHFLRTDFHDVDRDDVFYCHTTYVTNVKNIPKDYLRSFELMKIVDPYYYTVYVLGMWGGKKVEAPFAHAFERPRHVAPCHYNPMRPLGIALDFNIDPFAFVYYQYWVEGGKHHLHIFEEETILGGTVDEAIKRIKVKFGGALATTTIQGDYNGNNRSMLTADKTSIYKTLQNGLKLVDRQFDLRPNPKHINSRNDVNYFLRHFDDFRIDGKCINTVRDFERVEINPDGSIKKSDRSQGSQRADHLDAVRYLVNGKDVQRWMDDHRKRNGFF